MPGYREDYHNPSADAWPGEEEAKTGKVPEEESSESKLKKELDEIIRPLREGHAELRKAGSPEDYFGESTIK